MTKLAIFLKKHQFQKKERVETNTWSNFLPTCGGLLGLFLGVTALSLVEIIYFSILRLFWNIRYSRVDEFDDDRDDNENNEIDEHNQKYYKVGYIANFTRIFISILIMLTYFFVIR